MPKKVRATTENPKQVLLEYTNLARRYSSQWALNGVDGYLAQGEVVALQGENGSGKSTLLLTLAGILRAHRGKIIFAEGVGAHLVAHYPMAYTALSVEKNLELASALLEPQTFSIDDVLSYWQISFLKPKPLAALSRGQMQRFLLARAMLSNAHVYFLDEPFTGLDVRGEELLKVFIRDLRLQGAAILFSDHDHLRAQKLATRTIRLVDGRCAL
ncbi:MAG: Lipopolysaccharide export system ATP-binding protein LptB [Turneriella sp.]|nr:Lipopolysaccharide export system ATP-binding protein LptB [Turneriella sp.]